MFVVQTMQSGGALPEHVHHPSFFFKKSGQISTFTCHFEKNRLWCWNQQISAFYYEKDTEIFEKLCGVMRVPQKINQNVSRPHSARPSTSPSPTIILATTLIVWCNGIYLFKLRHTIPHYARLQIFHSFIQSHMICLLHWSEGFVPFKHRISIQNAEKKACEPQPRDTNSFSR